jgi:hypothetical protein
MTQHPSHEQVVRQWCVSLGVLTAVSVASEDADLKIAAYVPLLADRFPAGAFTSRSLEHVAARAVKGFPTYGELTQWLAEWWRDHRPPYTALAAPPPQPIRQREEPTPEEIAHVERVVAETIAFLRAGTQPVEERRPPKPSYMTPEQLDKINPLPNGFKRAG